MRSMIAFAAPLVSVVALAVAGCGSGDGGAAGGGTAGLSAAPLAGGAGPAAPLPPGVVEVTVTEKGFEPDRIPAEKGKELTLLITRKFEKTCATEIVIKDPPVRKDLPMNTPVEVKITPTKEGEIAFACAMNMIGGYIVVK